MPFVFTTLKEKEKFVKDLQTRSLSCATYLQHVHGWDTNSAGAFVTHKFNPLLHTFMFPSDVWIPTICLSTTMGQNDATAKGENSGYIQSLILTFSPTPLKFGLLPLVPNITYDPANELASMLTGWSLVPLNTPGLATIGDQNGYGTKTFELDPNGIFVPANKPIFIFFYSRGSNAVTADPTFLVKAAIYYIPLPE